MACRLSEPTLDAEVPKFRQTLPGLPRHDPVVVVGRCAHIFCCWFARDTFHTSSPRQGHMAAREACTASINLKLAKDVSDDNDGSSYPSAFLRVNIHALF